MRKIAMVSVQKVILQRRRGKNRAEEREGHWVSKYLRFCFFFVTFLLSGLSIKIRAPDMFVDTAAAPAFTHTVRELLFFLTKKPKLKPGSGSDGAVVQS